MYLIMSTIFGVICFMGGIIGLIVAHTLYHIESTDHRKVIENREESFLLMILSLVMIGISLHTLFL